VSQPARLRAVLDVDIIYSRVLHDLMGRVARDLRLLDLFWSEQLLAEASNTLVEKKGLTEEVAQRWVNYLRQNFPAGETKIDEVFASTDFTDLSTDPKDRHVCALAIAADADYLCTHDRGYLQEGLQRHGIEVAGPDPFLCVALENNTEGVLEILGLIASDWAGGRTIEELLDAIARAGAPTFAAKAQQALRS
jgi:predicted nucleic acid-binding protein